MWRINIVTMLFFMLVQVVVPLIPRYALEVGAEPFIIGIAVSSISVAAILLRPFSGIASDKWSRSKLMLLGMAFGVAAYGVLYAFGGINAVIVSRLLEGIGVALFVPSSMASAVDMAPEGKVGQALGWRSLMVGIGFSVGPALGSVLSESFGYRPTFGIAAGLICLLIPLAVFREARRVTRDKGVSFEGLRERNFLLATSSLVVYAVAWMGLLTFLSAYLKILGYGDIEIGLFVSIQAAASLVLRILAGRVSDSHPATMTWSGLLMISLSFLLIWLNQVPPFLYFSAVIFGIGVGIFVPGSQTMALARSPARSRGLLASIHTMGVDVGNLIGPILFGAVIQSTGSYVASFAMAPAIALAAGLIVLVPSAMGRRAKPGAEPGSGPGSEPAPEAKR